MTDSSDNSTSQPAGANGGSAPSAGGAPELRVLAQYARDLSFENPLAPQSLTPSQKQPQLNVGVEIQAKGRPDNTYEVDLKITATANRDENEVLFIVELTYGGLFRIVNVPENQLQAVIMIECPRILFPFARRIISDATRDGGIVPPLMLDPIDFVALFRQQMEAQKAQQEQGASA